MIQNIDTNQLRQLFDDSLAPQPSQAGQTEDMKVLFAEQPTKTKPVDSYSYQQAFERNVGLITGPELARLRSAHVAIAGLGGVGGAYIEILARQGIGGFSISDLDRFEIANFNRQFGASMETVGRSKIEVAAERIRSINPEAHINQFPEGLNKTNMDAFVSGADVVVDGLDFFSIDLRRVLYRCAAKKGIPVVTSGPMGFGATLHVFMPGEMTFDEYFDLNDDQSYAEKLLRFTVGVAPQGLHRPYMDISTIRVGEKRGPSSAAAISLCAAFVTTEVLRLILGWPGVKAAPHYRQLDMRRGIWHEGKLRWGNRGLIQRIKLQVGRKLFARAIQELEQTPKKEVIDPQKESIARIVEAAMAAPSGDNCQPFRFVWTGAMLQVRLDKPRARHALDRQFHISTITLGGVLESIEIAARYEGYDAEVTLISDPELGPGADVRLISARRSVDELLPGVALRHTDRRMYKGGTLSAPAFFGAEKDAKNFDQAGLSFIDHSGPELLNYIRQAETFVWTKRFVQSDLMRWMRLGRKSVIQTRDGLPGETLGIAVWERWVLALCRFWPVQRVLNAVAFLKVLRKRTVDLILSSAALGVITVRSNEPEALVQAGRLFFRTWCRLNMNGYGLHPLTMGAISIYDKESGVMGDVGAPYEKLFQAGRQVLTDAFGLSDGETPVLLFRTGRSNGNAARTLRRPVSDVLTIKKEIV